MEGFSFVRNFELCSILIENCTANRISHWH